MDPSPAHREGDLLGAELQWQAVHLVLLAEPRQAAHHRADQTMDRA